MYRLLLLLIILIAANSSISHAQVGFKVSQLSPYGSIGEYYNKAPAIEAFLFGDDGNIRKKLTFFYSSLTPRIDSMPVYAVRVDPGNNTQTAVPGFITYNRLTLSCIAYDVSYRIVHVKKLFLFGGMGLVVGDVHTNYVKEYKSISTDAESLDMVTVGFKLCGDLEYRLSDHVGITGAYTYNGLIGGDYHTKFTNTLISIGVNYSFEPFDE